MWKRNDVQLDGLFVWFYPSVYPSFFSEFWGRLIRLEFTLDRWTQPIFPSKLVSSVFSLSKKKWGRGCFLLKSLELERVRTIEGFVERNIASNVNVLTRQKSQGKGKTFKNNTRSKRKPLFFLQYYPRYMEETSLGLGSSLRKFPLKKKWCIRVFFSSTWNHCN